ncbi:hypothetical protein F441_22299 [Phytophthora nicotianae CJ01A1]|uniref:Uncharacterized protein n=1 Tax=Phytophthora nicotianae CJ01A1 TaxID=1317063 RepID=W2VQ24_PHYNI|nr:hypothetical protein F441_22299 [Phytophthora nicotianae CJ01A1]
MQSSDDSDEFAGESDSSYEFDIAFSPLRQSDNDEDDDTSPLVPPASPPPTVLSKPIDWNETELPI